MENLAKAIIEVMKAVKNVEKSMTVGSGNNSYKGVADKEVKEAYNKAMVDNGLCILPVDIEPNIHISRWEEETNYGKKQKQSVFTEVKTKYLLLHISGESQEITGYGHGIDSQDKGAGKATTYALKYALLYTFMTPTGKIDDADNTHSDDAADKIPKAKKEENPVTIEQALKEVKTIKTEKERGVIWNKYKQFQNDDKFKSAIILKAKELK